MLQYQYWDVMSRETKPTKDLWLKSRHVKPRNKQFSICTIGSKSTTIKYQIKFCMYVEAISISGMLKVYLNYMNISLYLENKYWNEVASGKITWITTCNRDGQNLKLHCNCFCRLKNLIFRPYFKSKKLNQIWEIKPQKHQSLLVWHLYSADREDCRRSVISNSQIQLLTYCKQVFHFSRAKCMFN